MSALEPGNTLESQSLENSHDLKCSDVYDKNDELGQEKVALSSVQGSEMENRCENTVLHDKKEGNDFGNNDDGSNAHAFEEGNNVEDISEGHTENLKSPDLEPKPEPEPTSKPEPEPEPEPEPGPEKPETEPVPTDEYGRELSAYEIMRLERIQRNQAKLAQLGLEDASRRISMEDRKKKTKKRSITNTNEISEHVERRQTISRKSKIKEVNYSDEPKLLETKSTGEKKVAKPSHKKKLDQTVPLCIYKEMKQVASNRRHVVKLAEKNLRYAETEYRYAKRQVDIFDRKELRRRQKEERRKIQEQNAEENRAIIPVLQEIDRKLWEITMARNQVSIEIQRNNIAAFERDNIAKAEIEAARVRFPQSLREMEHSLDFLLHERLPFLKEKDIDANNTLDSSLKRKHDAGEMSKNHNDLPLNPSTSKKKKSHGNSTFATESLHIQSIGLQPKAHEKTKKPKSRNVGGPISQKFSLSLQRKWLEADDAVAPSTLTHFVPQVGDTILYYPSAHYEFLHEYPDIRCLKSNLRLRRPLWLRAKDEIKIGNDVDKQREKKKWWTLDWISSLRFTTGSYPIICRVERTVPEFPHDREAEGEAKKQKSMKQRSEKGQAVIGEKKIGDCDEKHIDQSKKRSLRRSKPHIGLSVTLRPLTHIIPPTQSKDRSVGENLFEKDSLSLPPLFSVLTFPSERSQFLIPFSWAYRSSLSLSNGDRVKKLGGYSSTIVPNGNPECFITNSMFDFFEEIIRKNAKIDFSDAHELDKFISDSYTKKSGIAECVLPEADLRAAVQVILFQQYKKKAATEEAGKLPQQDTNNSSSSQDLSFSVGKTTGGSSGSVTDLIKWIQMTLPRWEGLKIQFEHDGTQCETSPWSLIKLGTKKIDSDQNDALAAALAPSVLISSSTSNNGGMLYNIHEHLRSQIEKCIKEFIATHAEAAMFVPVVTDKVAPAYSCYVPHVISFRKILTRLKVRQMKFLKEQRQSSDDPNQQQATENAHCCYYRSTGAILSDLSNVYHNCLLYNDPESDIILAAEKVTSKVKALVEKLESSWIREMKLKEKEEREAARNAKLVAHGKEDLTSFPNPSYSTTVEAEAYGVYFNGKLNRDWIQDTGSDEINQVNAQTSSNVRTSLPHWTPQCGDKVLYNRQMHGKFVNGHFPSLTKAQRILPHVLPKKNMKKKHVLDSSNCFDSDRNEHQFWMLGTVKWVRAIFPSPASNQAEVEVETFDIAAPLLAVGIQFHYNWLSDIYVVYWRPCEIIIKGESSDLNKSSHDDKNLKAADALSTCSHVHTGALLDSAAVQCTKRRCKQCNLSLEFSFIYPAWKGNNERILPPFPMSLSRVQLPMGLPDKVLFTIESCFKVLKQRCIDKTRIDYFDPKIEFGELERLFDLLPPRIQNIVLDSEDEKNELPSDEDSEEMTHDVLCQVHFFPPWCRDKKEPHLRGIPTRTKPCPVVKVLIKINDSFSGGHNELNSDDINLSQPIILEPKDYEDNTRLRAVLCMPSTQNDDPVVPLHEAIMPFPNLSLDLIQKRLRNKYYRSRLAVAHDIREAFGSSIYYYLTKKGKVQYINEESSKRVLEELFHTCDIVKNLVEGRKEILEVSEYNFSLPTLSKRISSQSKEPKNKPCLTTTERRLLQRLLIIRKLHAAALISVLETPTVEIAFALRRKQKFREEYSLSKERKLAMKQADSIIASMFVEPYPHRARLSKTEPFPVVKVLIKSNDSFSGGHNELNSDDINLSQPIILEPKDYEGNTRLLSAALCMPNRKKICARCRMCKYSLLTCRVRKAHSNIDFHQWLDYLKGVGGVNGLMKLLLPSYVPQIASLVPAELSVAAIHSQSPLSTAYAGPPSYVVTTATESSQGKALDCQNMKDFDFARDKVGTLHDNNIDTVLRKICSSTSQQPALEHTYNSVVMRNNDNPSNGTVTTSGQDQIAQKTEESQRNLYEVLKKSELALKLGRDAVTLATEMSKSKRLLSDEFIQATFHVDPTDGHYLLCIICGLGGDVLCCETCAIVSHYQCVDLAAVPTGDWYCTNCSNDSEEGIGKDSSNIQPKIESGNVTSHDLTCRAQEEENNAKGTVLKKLLDELRWNRLKERGDELKLEHCENGKGEAVAIAAPNEDKRSSEKVGGRQECRELLKYDHNDTEKCEAKSSVNSEKGNRTIESVDLINLENTTVDVSNPKLGRANVELGTRIRKEFDEVFYTGTVVALPSRKSDYFKVEYEDGDEEDLSENELDVLLGPGETQHANAAHTSEKFSGILEISSEFLIPHTNNASTKKKRGRPRKTSKTENSKPVRKRGRPRKNEIALKAEYKLPTPRSNGKRGRGRPRKVLDITPSNNDAANITMPSTHPQGNAIDKQTMISPSHSSAEVIMLDAIPEPISGERDENYYCAVENDTCTTIAAKLGLESWRDVAGVPENRIKYGSAIDNVKTRFKKGTLFRILPKKKMPHDDACMIQRE